MSFINLNTPLSVAIDLLARKSVEKRASIIKYAAPAPKPLPKPSPLPPDVRPKALPLAEDNYGETRDIVSPQQEAIEIVKAFPKPPDGTNEDTVRRQNYVKNLQEEVREQAAEVKPNQFALSRLDSIARRDGEIGWWGEPKPTGILATAYEYAKANPPAVLRPAYSRTTGPRPDAGIAKPSPAAGIASSSLKSPLFSQNRIPTSPGAAKPLQTTVPAGTLQVPQLSMPKPTASLPATQNKPLQSSPPSINLPHTLIPPNTGGAKPFSFKKEGFLKKAEPHKFNLNNVPAASAPEVKSVGGTPAPTGGDSTPAPTPEPNIQDTAINFGKNVVLPYAGIGAVAGAGLSALRHYTQNPEERKRSIWDALLTGGLTGAGVGMGVYGAKSLYNEVAGGGDKPKGDGGAGAGGKPKGIMRDGVEYEITPELATSNSPEAIAARKKLDELGKREEILGYGDKALEYGGKVPRFALENYPMTGLATAGVIGESAAFHPMFRRDPYNVGKNEALTAANQALASEGSSPIQKALSQHSKTQGIQGSTIGRDTRLLGADGVETNITGRKILDVLRGTDPELKTNPNLRVEMEGLVEAHRKAVEAKAGKPVSTIVVAPEAYTNPNWMQRNLLGRKPMSNTAEMVADLSNRFSGNDAYRPFGSLKEKMLGKSDVHLFSAPEASPEAKAKIEELKKLNENDAKSVKDSTAARTKLEADLKAARTMFETSLTQEQLDKFRALDADIEKYKHIPEKVKELVATKQEILRTAGKKAPTHAAALEALQSQLKANPDTTAATKSIVERNALIAEQMKAMEAAKPTYQPLTGSEARVLTKPGITVDPSVHRSTIAPWRRSAEHPIRGGPLTATIKGGLPLSVFWLESQAAAAAARAENDADYQKLFDSKYLKKKGQ